MAIEFYDVKTKSKLQITEEFIRKVSFSKKTKFGKLRVRYALRATFEGRKLMKFINQDTFENTNVPEEDL